MFEATVIEAPLLGQHIQCLSGHDVLAHAVLIDIGYGNLFRLSFSSPPGALTMTSH